MEEKIMKNRYYKFAKEIFNIDSPSGYTSNVINYIKLLVTEMGFESTIEAYFIQQQYLK